MSVSDDGVLMLSDVHLAADRRALRPTLHEAQVREASQRRRAPCSRARTARAAVPRSGGPGADSRCRRRASRWGRSSRTRRSPTRIEPVEGAMPASARRKSRWPLPSTPARPTTSPGLDRQRHAAEAVARSGRPRPGAARCAQRLGVAGRALGREDLLDGAPDDELDDIRLGDVSALEGPARLAVAQDRDAVCDAQHLGDAVRDVDDRAAALPDVRERSRRAARSRARSGARSARRGRAPAGSSASALAISMMKRRCIDRSRDAGVRVDGDLPGSEASAAHAPGGADAAREARANAEPHVLGDRQVRQQRRVLSDDGETQPRPR